MASELLFDILGNAVLVGWLCLFSAVFFRPGTRVHEVALAIGGVATPAALATLPLWDQLIGTGPRAGDLFSLSGIESRFADVNVLFLLYFETLAFSLFVGGLIARDRHTHGMARLIAVPSLIILFFMGPVGALIYGSARWFVVRYR